MLRAPQVVFPSTDSQSPGSPVRAAEGRPGGCSLQCCWVPASRGRPVPPSLLPARQAGGRAGERANWRAEPQPGGFRWWLLGRRAGRSLGTCCTAAASPGRASCVTALPGSACVHVTPLAVQAGVRPRVLSTLLPPASSPVSFLRLSPSSDASSRKPSEKSQACGNLFVERRPHPLHSLLLAASGQLWPGSSRTPFVVYPIHHYHSILQRTLTAGNSASHTDPAVILLSSGNRIPSLCSVLKNEDVTKSPVWTLGVRLLVWEKMGPAPLPSKVPSNLSSQGWLRSRERGVGQARVTVSARTKNHVCVCVGGEQSTEQGGVEAEGGSVQLPSQSRVLLEAG